MFKYYSLLTFTLNTKGGVEIASEKLTTEVNGELVPCDESESILRLHDKISKTGGNNATQNIKCILFDTDGIAIKTDEVNKPAE